MPLVKGLNERDHTGNNRGENLRARKGEVVIEHTCQDFGLSLSLSRHKRSCQKELWTLVSIYLMRSSAPWARVTMRTFVRLSHTASESSYDQLIVFLSSRSPQVRHYTRQNVALVSNRPIPRKSLRLGGLNKYRGDYKRCPFALCSL